VAGGVTARAALAFALAAALSGCQLGPGRLKVSSAHYSDAVRVASSEQLLVNLVRLRYRDLPVFLGVSSISTQFELDAGLDASGEAGLPGADSVGVGAGVRYSERPTVSFSVRGGEDFQLRMLRHVPVVAVALLVESGWRFDRVVRLLLEEMNGLENAPTASGPTPARAPEYREFLEAATLLQTLVARGEARLELRDTSSDLSDALPTERVEGRALVEAVLAGTELRRAPGGDGYRVVKTERTPALHLAAAASPEADRLRELLRLSPSQERFEIVALETREPGPFVRPDEYHELVVDVRSLMGALFYLSHGVDVPQADLEAGRATTTRDAADAPFDWSTVLAGLFRVRASEDEPDGAAVAVRHRGHWFHVADDDESSKSTFMLIDQLFTLTAGASEDVNPVLTLDVGG
jgi:hypothetical protein